MSGILLPAEDRTLSPLTGWTRNHLLAVADTILDGAARHSSPAQSLIRYPGRPGGYGAEVDALEGFSRTFMLAAFRIAGDPTGTTALAERYARGFAAGVAPHGPERWLRPDEVDQAKVEAAALALGLHLTRDTVWARLSDDTKAQTIDYLGGFVGASYPPNNWAWFRLIVEQFLASVGGPYSPDDQSQDLALLDTFDREGGWIADGVGRAFDHYSGWALPFYPIIWADMVAGDPRHKERLARYRARLDDYLDDALHLIGADGAPLFQGRSLTYRFASAGPAWAAVFSGTTRHDLGMLRRAASGQIKHFVEHDAPGADGILSLGWHHPWRPIAQNYSGQGSPYWAAKGMLGIALPAAHPVWTATEAPLPIDAGDFHRVIAVPGWLASGTVEDGIVRIVNHGTDHRLEGDLQPDAPLYAKLGYSTTTAPVLAGPGVVDPLDGTVALVRDGRPSHRSGFTVGMLREEDGTMLGASGARAHWPHELDDGPDHGVGTTTTRGETGPIIDVVSAVRGAWEVRFVRIRDEHDPLRDRDELRIGGWALSASDVATEAPTADAAGATAGAHHTRIVALHGLPHTSTGVRLEVEATPLASRTAIPWLSAPPETTDWVAVAVLLGAVSATPVLTLQSDGTWLIDWADGTQAVVRPDDLAASIAPSSV